MHDEAMTAQPPAVQELTLSELESHLWEAANILRGPVDRTDWKSYIFPLLFFKRICDVWDEETPRRSKLCGDVDRVDFPEVHRFAVPRAATGTTSARAPANVGAALAARDARDRAANPDTLYRVFGAADWGNREMLTDEILKDLIEDFSEVSLGNARVALGRPRRRLRVPDRQVRRRHERRRPASSTPRAASCG